MKRLLQAGAVLLGVLALAAGAPLALDCVPAADTTPPPPPAAEQVAQGRLVALAGNCAGCHTERGGAPYAGGRAIATPFGTVYAGNLTPDAETGLGRWSAAQFRRALRHGVGADGRRLVPAFPYTETTKISDADADALFAFLRSLPPVKQARPAHALRWPYGTQTALAAWRLAFFRPGAWQDDPARSRAWNRGAYLVNGAGHCVACHGGRNALGGTADAGFGGGLIPARAWYAPAFTRATEAGVADWPLADIVALLREGAAPRGRAIGPMAEVVVQSTQHLPEADLQAMAVYLQSLPQQPPAPRAAFVAPPAEVRAQGARLYTDHCAGCHGDDGDGGALPDGRLVVPALAGNRLLAMDPAVNLVRAIALGGFGAPTAARPQPFGMPPFAHVLDDEQLAAVATHLRTRWGAGAGPVSALDVARWRGADD